MRGMLMLCRCRGHISIEICLSVTSVTKKERKRVHAFIIALSLLEYSD